MRVNESWGRFFLVVAAVVGACSPEIDLDEGEGEAASGAGGTGGANGGRDGTTMGSGSSGEPSTGGSSVGGGRGLVGGAGGMGAYGGKPPIGSAGTMSAGRSGSAGDAGTSSGNGTGGGAGSGEPSRGGTEGLTGGSSGTSGGGTTGAAGTGGAAPQAGGSGGKLGGTAGGTGGTSTPGGGAGASPVGVCNDELLVNAGFESGKGVGWTETSDWPGIDLVVSGDEPALTAEGVAPFAGGFLAWLGGIPDNEWDHHVTMIEQHVLIPPTASALTLSGRHLVKSIDDADAEYDEAYLEFDLADRVVWQSLRLTNQSASNGWVTFSKTTTDLEDLRGKTLLFYAYARTDLTGKTSFFLDSLSLVASCGR